MKKLLYILLSVSSIFIACEKDEESQNNIQTDIRNQIIGNFDATYTMNITNLIDTNQVSGPNSGGIRVVKSGTSNISITMIYFGPGGEDITFNCDMIYQSSGGLTFEIIEENEIVMQDLDLFGPGPNWTLYGVDGPQNYNTANNELQISFVMENGNYIIEMELTAIKNN
jgi:hypothetical protein